MYMDTYIIQLAIDIHEQSIYAIGPVNLMKLSQYNDTNYKILRERPTLKSFEELMVNNGSVVYCYTDTLDSMRPIAQIVSADEGETYLFDMVRYKQFQIN